MGLVPKQGILAAVRATSAMFLRQDAGVINAAITMVTAVGTSNVVSYKCVLILLCNFRCHLRTLAQILMHS